MTTPESITEANEAATAGAEPITSAHRRSLLLRRAGRDVRTEGRRNGRHGLRAVPGHKDPGAAELDARILLGQATGELAAVGIDAAEERVYRALLAEPGPTVPGLTLREIAGRLGLPTAEVTLLVDTLVDLELVTVSPGQPVRYVASPPDLAIEALIAQQKQELHHVRLTAAYLTDQARRAAARRPAAQPLVEAVTGHHAVTCLLDQLCATACSELLLVADMAQLLGDSAASVSKDSGVEGALARGVQVRAVYDPQVFEDLEGHADAIQTRMAAGEQARALTPLPGGLMLVDRQLGILPRAEADGTFTSALLVRSSPLLDTLAALFDCLWSRAIPLTAAAEPAEEQAEADRVEELLVPLLAAGLKDHAVARQLGVSTRTLDRRIRAMMDDMAAQTRFQAGWVAAYRQNGFQPEG